MTSAAESNLEIIRRAIEAIESGDAERFGELVDEVAHPEIEWTPLIAVGIEGTYRGRDRLVSFFRDMHGSFEPRYEELELRSLGDDVVLAACQLKLTGRESELEFRQEMGSVFEFEDGLLRRGHAYPTHAEAREAAERIHA